MKRVLLTISALAIAVAALYVGESLPRPALAATNSVRIVSESDGFDPASITIAKGESIQWTNDDNIDHTVTSGTSPNDDSVWEERTLTPNQSFSQSFSTVGTFPYFCFIHPTMTGTVVVQAPTATPTPTPTSTPTPTPTPSPTGTPTPTARLSYPA